MRKLLVALGATFVVLLGTGVDQAFRYQPHVTKVRLGQRSLPGFDRTFVLDATELVHRVGAYVFAALVVAVAVVWILRYRRATRSMLVSVVVLVVLALATVAEIITGRGIRWSQLALQGVTVGDDIRGVVGLDHVKDVMIGSTELAWSEYSSRVFLHLVVFPVGLVLVGAVVWYLSVRDDRRRIASATSAAPEEPDDLLEVPT